MSYQNRLIELVGIDGIWWAVNVSEVLTLLFCAFLLLRFAPQLVRRKGK